MQVKKSVWFEKPGEKERLNELCTKHTNESSLAIAIEKEFSIDFTDAMTIASRWLEVIKNKKSK